MRPASEMNPLNNVLGRIKDVHLVVHCDNSDAHHPCLLRSGFREYSTFQWRRDGDEPYNVSSDAMRGRRICRLNLSP